MGIGKKVRVLIVDDSIFFREMLAKSLAEDAGVEVVGTASNPFEASEKIVDLNPDVVTLDVEMPRMNGIEFLKKLMPQYPVPVVVVSGGSNIVFDAMNAGAVDFINKGDVKNPDDFNRFAKELVVKVKIASTAKVGQHKRNSSVERVSELGNSSAETIIAIGASTGGTEAILEVIKAFPRDMPGIVIVQHMPSGFTKMYSDRLNNICAMEVKEARDGDVVSRGRVLIAPGDFHMKIYKEGTGYRVRCIKGEKVSGHCPSVDVLFDSVAEKAGKNAIGVILTGMGSDGAKGLLNMKKSGAYTIGQDEKSSVVYGMPMVSYNIGAVIKQISLDKIACEIMESVRRMCKG